MIKIIQLTRPVEEPDGSDTHSWDCEYRMADEEEHRRTFEQFSAPLGMGEQTLSACIVEGKLIQLRVKTRRPTSGDNAMAETVQICILKKNIAAYFAVQFDYICYCCTLG